MPRQLELDGPSTLEELAPCLSQEHQGCLTGSHKQAGAATCPLGSASPVAVCPHPGHWAPAHGCICNTECSSFPDFSFVLQGIQDFSKRAL